MTAPEHATVARSDSFYADLKRGVKYALARRAKLLAYAAAAVAFLITNGYIHGQAELIVNIVIGVLGGGVLHQVPNLSAVATGPKASERATERGNADVIQPADEASLTAETEWPAGQPAAPTTEGA